MRMTHMAKYAVVVGAVVTPLVMSAQGSYASTDATGSAFGLSATGPVPISPVPVVPTTSAQQPTRKSLAELPANSLAEASVLNAAAWAGHGRASVTDLKLSKPALAASVIGAKCENGNGTAHLVKAVLNGRKLASSPRANTTITVPQDQTGATSQIVKVILNKQVRNPDGSLTVTAIELATTLAPGKTETISIASATCSRMSAGEGAPADGAGAPSAPSAGGTTDAAPAPTPVNGDLPVTG